MSRIGRKPVKIPEKVEARVRKNTLTVQGPLGELNYEFHPDITVKVADDHIIATRPSDSKKHKALHGLTRALIQNTLEGVSRGFQKNLEIQGVGYNVERKSDTKILLNLGYSHPILFEGPEDITLEIPDNTHIRVKGMDKQLVGQVAAKIRSFRPPEPYKGKGIRYVDEYVRRKAGKAAVAK